MSVCASLYSKLQLTEVGEKAFHLSDMAGAGYPVPKGFVIKNIAFERRNISEERIEISAWIQEIGAEKYMVRSSAIGEDGAKTSFAGQLSSFLTSNNIEDILEHIEQCWASYFHENVLTYQKTNNQYLAGMGVIIQELVDPDYAGVIFSESPNDASKMLAEFVEGHAEKLVSGQVNPASFEVLKSDFTTLKQEPLPFDEQPLLKYTSSLEKHYAYPVDVEWVIKDGKTSIVQCRPITIASIGKKIFWSNTNVNENYPDPISPLLYSIARDSYYHYFKNLSGLLQIPFEKIQALESAYSNVIGSWGAKMYYNMSSIHAIISASPFASFLMKSFDNFIGYQEGSKSETSPSNWKQKVKFIRSFFRLNRQLDKHVETFEHRADQFVLMSKEANDAESLKLAFHEFINIRMHHWYRASLADFFAMIYHGLLGKVCKTYDEESAEETRNVLIQAIPGLISSKPISETWKIAQMIHSSKEAKVLFESESSEDIYTTIQTKPEFSDLKTTIDTYLTNWGFRCSGELMFTTQNYIDQPLKYIELLKNYLSIAHEDPSSLIQKKHQESLIRLSEVKKYIFRKWFYFFPAAYLEWWLFHFIVKQAIKGISSRERVRLKQASLYYHFRKLTQRVAKLKTKDWKNSKDIFFLKYQEIQTYLGTSEMLPELRQDLISNRKKAFEETSSLVYPDDFITIQNEYPLPKEVFTASPNSTEDGLKGMIACGGYVKGRAKVLSSVLESSKLQKGDILVTRQTDPGWASVFPLISGLVVERGGMLSHGAIVAREFGIPAVIGVKDATIKIPDDSIIEIRANSGKIILHD